MARWAAAIAMGLVLCAWPLFAGEPCTLSPVEPWDGICPCCKAEGRTSTVRADGFCTTTAMYCGGGYYDEQGGYHEPAPCNTTTRGYNCSNGHAFARSWETI